MINWLLRPAGSKSSNVRGQTFQLPFSSYLPGTPYAEAPNAQHLLSPATRAFCYPFAAVVHSAPFPRTQALLHASRSEESILIPGRVPFTLLTDGNVTVNLTVLQHNKIGLNTIARFGRGHIRPPLHIVSTASSIFAIHRGKYCQARPYSPLPAHLPHHHGHNRPRRIVANGSAEDPGDAQLLGQLLQYQVRLIRS